MLTRRHILKTSLALPSLYLPTVLEADEKPELGITACHSHYSKQGHSPVGVAGFFLKGTTGSDGLIIHAVGGWNTCPENRNHRIPDYPDMDLVMQDVVKQSPEMFREDVWEALLAISEEFANFPIPQYQVRSSFSTQPYYDDRIPTYPDTKEFGYKYSVQEWEAYKAKA